MLLFTFKIYDMICLNQEKYKILISSEEERMIVLVSDPPPAGWTMLPVGETLLDTPPTEDVAADGGDQPRP